MSKWHREKINPIEFMQQHWPGIDISHIEYDPGLKRSGRQYSIIRQTGHDGTLLLTLQLLRGAVIPLMKQESCFKPDMVDNDTGLIGMRYKIGPIQLSTCVGMVDLKCGRYPGQVERVRIPVICEKVYQQ